ncbi:MAG: DUF4215 domain-containing protein [Kofleriaceae bacterium]
MRARSLCLALVTAVVGLATTATADTIITGGNVINQTWTPAGSPYIVQGDITVPAGASLTIDAGTTVQFAATDGQASGVDTARVELIVRGALTVNGTVAQPVAFTAAAATAGSWYGVVVDPAATGTAVTAANLTLAYPRVGIYHRSAAADVSTAAVAMSGVSDAGVRVEAGSPTYNGVTVVGGTYGFDVTGAASATLTNCISRAATSTGVRFTSTGAGRSLAVTNCTIAGTSSYGVYASTSSTSTVAVTSSIVTGFSFGLYRATSLVSFANSYSDVWGNNADFGGGVTAGTATISANPLYVSSSNLRLTSNSPARFGALGGGDMGALPYISDATPGWTGVLWTPTVMTAAGGPYAISGDLTVPAGGSLTIGAGAVLTFAATDLMAAGVDTARVELIVRGALTVNGTVAQPVAFTAASATAGSWYGVVVDPAATGTAITAANLTLAYPGSASTTGPPPTDVSTAAVAMSGVSDAGVRVEAGSPTYNGVTVVGGTYGFDVTGAASATLTNCISRAATSTGVRFTSTGAGRSLAVTNCTIAGTSSYGVYASTSSTSTVTVTNAIVTGFSFGLYRATSLVSFANSYADVWGNNADFGGGVTAGTATISANPLYVSSSNLRLTSNSPARFGALGGGDMGALPYISDATPGWTGVLWTPTVMTAAGGPYAISGDLTVPAGGSLTIGAGAVLTFAATDLMASGVDTARVELIVRGALTVNGTVAQPVAFTAASATAGSWYGVVVDPAATGTAITAANLTLAYPRVGIYHRSAAADVSTAAVAMSGVSDAGVRVEAGSPTYNGVTVVGGTYGFDVTGAASATLTNCISRAATSTGVRFTSTGAGRSLAVTNCTIAGTSSYGVYASTSSTSTVTVTNAIVTGFSFGLYRATSLVSFANSYSDVWGNNADFGGGVTAGTATISANPLFVSSTDLRLQPSSVCIDAGTATGAPATDIRGAARPLDGDGLGGAQFDLGAYEFALVVVCGNGAVEPGEACDSGAANGTYGNCNATCTGLGPRCGDGVTNGPETCDDGNAVDTDACRNTCVVATCGDGVVRTGVEQCDDGNTVNTDACTNACAPATCGDGIVRTGVEQCDDGNASNSDACLTTCVPASCGDGFVRTGVEQCDDGNTSNTDACVGACTTATCGDGFVHTGVEACDDGNTIDTDACNNACMAPSCGDGVVQAGEECDDGNTVDTDACRANCMAARCGDGVVRTGVEQCDDGNTVNTDACTATCQAAVCGDGILHVGVEECDDANTIDTDACVAGCVAARCGDGLVRAGVEACDDGNTDNTDGCTNACALSSCGDGVVQAGEECDDANTVETDACRNSCLAARCGDLVVQTGVEGCDDGNTADGDGCSAACQVESSTDAGVDGPGPDAGTGPDAGGGDGGGGGGCCSTGADSGPTAALGALLVVGLLRRRRRRPAAV